MNYYSEWYEYLTFSQVRLIRAQEELTIIHSFYGNTDVVLLSRNPKSYPLPNAPSDGPVSTYHDNEATAQLPVWTVTLCITHKLWQQNIRKWDKTIYEKEW